MQPETPSLWMRTKWLYTPLLPVCALIAVDSSDALVDGAAPLSLCAVFALTLLSAAFPLRAVLERRSTTLPWWWDAVWYALFGMWIAGWATGIAALFFVGFMPAVITTVLLVAALWFVEARHPVRAYSKMRSIVFVPKDGAR